MIHFPGRWSATLWVVFFVGGGLSGGGLSAQVTDPRENPGAVSTLQGTVSEYPVDRPLADAAVTLTSHIDDHSIVGSVGTSSEGRFVFPRVLAGIYTVEVSLLGYEPFADTLAVEANTEIDLHIRLSADPIELEPIVVVTERWRAPYMLDFEERRRRLDGVFIDREEIENRQPMVVSDLLRRVPVAQWVWTGSSYGFRLSTYDMSDLNVVDFAGAETIPTCRPEVWVDGNNMGPFTEIDDLGIPPEMIEAVEVHWRVGQIPVQYLPTECGVVLLWSRGGVTPDLSTTNRALWKRIALTLTVFGAAFFIMH